MFEPMVEMEGEGDLMVHLLPSSSSSSSSSAEVQTFLAHSELLRHRSEFFSILLSERWASPAPSPSPAPAPLMRVDITMYDDSAADIYIRCLKLMYVPGDEIVRMTCWVLSGVQDALEILRIAAQLLFHDCIDACMQYLEMLPSWTQSEEASIKSVLSSLQIPRVHPDLARRMNIPNHLSSSPMESSLLIMRRMLLHVLQESYKGFKSTCAPRHQNIDPSRPIPESMVLEVWNANMDLVKEKIKHKLDPKHVYLDRKEVTWNDVKSAMSTLSWMFSSLLALHVGDIVVDALSKDDTLSSLVAGFGQLWSADRKHSECLHDLISLLRSMMEAIQNGRVLLPQQSRIAFITTWLPVMQTIYPSNASEFRYSFPSLSSDFVALINTLPLFDREKFFKDCMKSPDGVTVFLSLNYSFATWCNSLRESIMIGQGQDLLLVDSS